ncbi:MAG: hypothetical protein R3E90_14020 [Marinicella sp.]|nr:hypothetical protein [Xanthomonadales bacterium]
MKIKYSIIFTIVICLTLLAACGSSVPRKELQNLPSLIEIIALDFNQNKLKLRVSHRNSTAREGNQLSCQLALKDFSPLKVTAINLPDLTNYATETITSEISLNQLTLDPQTHSNLPYVLDCFLFSSNFRKEHIIKKAVVYQTPGAPGIYR